MYMGDDDARSASVQQPSDVVVRKIGDTAISDKARPRLA